MWHQNFDDCDFIQSTTVQKQFKDHNLSQKSFGKPQYKRERFICLLFVSQASTMLLHARLLRSMYQSKAEKSESFIFAIGTRNSPVRDVPPLTNVSCIFMCLKYLPRLENHRKKTNDELLKTIDG